MIIYVDKMENLNNLAPIPSILVESETFDQNINKPLN